MQRCNATVRLGGELDNTVPLYGLSPAEVLVLRHIHGQDAVVDFAPAGNDRGKSIDERARLAEKYSAKFLTEVFPGAHPTYPATFAEIGVDVLGLNDDTDEPVAPRGKRGKSKNEDATASEESAVQAVDVAELE